MSKCRSCNAEISWVETAMGKKMPVNMDFVMLVPAKDGDTLIVTSVGSVVRGWRVGDAYEGRDAVIGQTSHFATCPHSGNWRKSD
jgi:hypothetical protein